MKNLSGSLLLSLLVLLGVTAHGSGASLPALDVSVSNSAGKLVYKGKTDVKGTFSTGKLEPGNYVVQFNSQKPIKGGEYAIVVGAGKKKVSAEAVAGEKFGKGGVALKVDVAAGNLTGQVAAAGQMTAGGKGVGNAKTKMVNGKKFVWIPGGELGSNLGGRWVEEGSTEAKNWQRLNSDGFRSMQDSLQNVPGRGN